MEQALRPVGVREAKNRFSELATAVNECGTSLTVLRNGRPWVVISPADERAAQKRERLSKLRALTALIERDEANEPDWDPSRTDKELLGDERMRRFG